MQGAWCRLGFVRWGSAPRSSRRASTAGGLVEPRRLMQGRGAVLGSCGEIRAAGAEQLDHVGVVGVLIDLRRQMQGACLPSRSRAVRSAPRSSRRATTAGCWLSHAARCRGVLLSWFCAVRSAPRSSSARTAAGFGLGRPRRPMQGRVAVSVSCGEVRAAVEQESDHGRVLVEPRRQMQGRVAVLVSCGEIGAAVEQESDHGRGLGEPRRRMQGACCLVGLVR